MVGCTVVLLTSAREAELRPEYTMVDGIIELEYPRVGVRRVRELTVTKLRGAGFLEGRHTYGIDEAGITLYSRVEATFGRSAQASPGEKERIPFGVAGVDALLGSGLSRCSSTLLLGAAGAVGARYAALAQELRAAGFTTILTGRRRPARRKGRRG